MAKRSLLSRCPSFIVEVLNNYATVAFSQKSDRVKWNKWKLACLNDPTLYFLRLSDGNSCILPYDAVI